MENLFLELYLTELASAVCKSHFKIISLTKYIFIMAWLHVSVPLCTIIRQLYKLSENKDKC